MARPVKLDDPQLRERLCDLVRAGHSRYEAAEAVGLTTETYRRYYRSHPDFAEMVEDAVQASADPVLAMLRDEALAGDITAAKEWLKHTVQPKSERAEVNVKVSHGLDEQTIASIADLRARLEGRAAPAELDVIDVDYEEDEDEVTED